MVSIGKFTFAISFALLAFTKTALSQDKQIDYVFGDCQGHASICEDDFNEIVRLESKPNNLVTTNFITDHPHIIKVSASQLEINQGVFQSKHEIINNLDHKFTITIQGQLTPLAAEKVVIMLGSEWLADIVLDQVEQP